MFFLLSLYMQQVLGFSALQAGLGYLAVALTAIVSSVIAQALVTRIGVKPALAGGPAAPRGARRRAGRGGSRRLKRPGKPARRC